MPSSTQGRHGPLTPLKRTLRTLFNFQTFRPGQEAVIAAIMSGRDTLAIMPTGAGKSLCYQLPALHLAGMTIVVSPLISLMQDQIDKLTALGVDASQINSTLTTREELAALAGIRQERPEFVLTTPERLTDPDFLQLLAGRTIDLVVVDEAHCISQWGHDFRPAYLELAGAISRLGRPPVLALTATAARDVAEDIVAQLQLRDAEIINTGVYRPNLSYAVEAVDGDTARDRRLLETIAQYDGAGIVYTSTVKQAEASAQLLHQAGHAAARYHGRLPARERHGIQSRFMSGDLRVIVATNAFGLGIDKPDIRFVIHYGMPGSLDAYYQESGRAGRDGEPARCLLLYHPGDRRTHRFFMVGRYPRFNDILAVSRVLEQAAGARLSLAEVQERTGGVAKSKVRVVLSLLADAGLVRTHRPTSFSLRDREQSEIRVQKLAEVYDRRGDADRQKLEDMIVYAQTAMCRWRKLVDYFGDPVDWDTCGRCDNCVREQNVPPLAGAA